MSKTGSSSDNHSPPKLAVRRRLRNTALKFKTYGVILKFIA